MVEVAISFIFLIRNKLGFFSASKSPFFILLILFKEVINMLSEQIEDLQSKEDVLTARIEAGERILKEDRAKLLLIKKAKQSLEKLEEQLNGQVNISE